MGVYHVSGLGLSPGALTVPMTSVYLLNAAMKIGHKAARQFFALSGRLESEEKPTPQAIIVFTSKEAIKGEEKLRYKSEWFPKISAPSGKVESVTRPIARYLKELIDYLNQTFNAEIDKPDIYFVEVDYRSFEDAYYKSGVTFNGLRDKEVWVNMVGGTNQINVALFLAGTYTAVPTRYYYLFQNNIVKLEPDWIPEKPKSKKSLYECVDNIIEQWYRCSLPPLNIGIGIILRKLYTAFETKEVISEDEVERILRERGFDKMHVRKLISSGYLIPMNGGFAKGRAFDYVIDLWLKINREGVDNFSKWKRWAESNGILHEVEI